MSRFNFFLSSLFCTGFPLTEAWVNKSNFHPSAVFKLHNFKVCKLVLWFQTTPLKGYKSFLTSLALSLHPFLPHCKATLPPSASVSSSLAPAPLEGVRGSWSKHTPAKAADSRRCSSCLRSRVLALVSRLPGCPFAGASKPCAPLLALVSPPKPPRVKPAHTESMLLMTMMMMRVIIRVRMMKKETKKVLSCCSCLWSRR